MKAEGSTLVAYSGGPDAAALYMKLLQEGESPLPVYVSYRAHDNARKTIIDKRHADASLALLGHTDRLVYVRAPLGGRAKGERNRFMLEEMCRLASTFGAQALAIGTLREDGDADLDPTVLQRHAMRPVITWDTYGVLSKTEQFQGLHHSQAEAMLQATWSCQMWYKQHCGRCYSCKARYRAFTQAFGRDATAYTYALREPE